jgi:hypothetical protein
LLGEAKWQQDRVSHRIISELIMEKTLKIRNALPDAGQDWRIYYVFFSRAGFTEAAQALAAEYEATLVDLEGLDQTLS